MAKLTIRKHTPVELIRMTFPYVEINKGDIELVKGARHPDIIKTHLPKTN